jgi:outer membrane receptor protein involved in Fe transport
MHRSPRLRRAGSAENPSALLFAVLLSLLAAAPPARAAEPDAEPPPEPSPGVEIMTITATRAERDVLEVPGNVTVIDREAIEESGVRSVPDLLRRQAGLALTGTTTNPAGVQVEARGFNNGGALGSSMLVLVDGRRANEADTGNTDWALMLLDEVESVEIVRGPASALYGDNAVGGVIHIRTRPHEGPPRVTVRGRVGRYETGGGSLKAAGTQGPFTGSLFVDGFTTEGYRHGADFDRYQVKGSLQATIGERVLLGASGGRYHDDRGLPGTLSQEEIDALGRRARDPGSVDDESEVEQYFVNTWFEALLADDVELRIQPHYRDRRDDATATYTTWGSIDTSTEKLSVGVDTQLQVDRPLFGMRHRLIAGFDFLYEETDRSITSAFYDRLSDNERSIYAAFLHGELDLTERLLLSTGVRYDHADLDLFVLDVNTATPATDEPSFGVWSPKAALTYRILPTFSTYVSYSRGFRLPNFDEDVPVVSTDPLPDLEPQISDSIEIGAKQRSERIDASLAVYYMEVRNEITWDPLGGPSGFGANANFNRVRHIGVETSLAVQILECLSLSGTYTFEDVEIRDADTPAFEGRKMPMTPRHRGSLGLFAKLPYQLELGANANLVGERILSNDFDRQLPKLDFYATLDLLMAWRPTFGEHLEGALTLALRNVTGEKYHDFGSRFDVFDPVSFALVPTSFFYPAATRTWEVGFTLMARR